MSADDLSRRLLTATRGKGDELNLLIHDTTEEVLRALVANPELDEDHLLKLLARHDLSPELLRQVALDPARSKAYRVRLALLRHPHAPASATLKFVPQLHLFDLVTVATLPAAPREIRASAEGSILQRLKQIPLGARISLARRAAGTQVISRLMLDKDSQVVEALLSNPRLTEAMVCVAIRDGSVPYHTVDLISKNPRWSVRHDVRFALIRNRHTPLARALQFLTTMSREDIRQLARDPAVPRQLKAYLEKTGPLKR